MVRYIFCDLDTAYTLDPEGYILAFCEDTDIEVGCGWSTRVKNKAPKQHSNIQVVLFEQLQELDTQHSISSRTQEQVDQIRAFAEETRRIFTDE